MLQLSCIHVFPMFSGRQARDELRQRLKVAKAGKEGEDTVEVQRIIRDDGGGGMRLLLNF